MAIKADHSTLPKPDKPEGRPPDAEPRFVQILAEHWQAQNDEDSPKPHAFKDAQFRHSNAGNCARAIGYAALNVEPSDPMDLTGVWNTHLGTLIHDHWQHALMERYPDARVEFKVRSNGKEGAGSVDANIGLPDGTLISYELKSVGGFAFKMAVGERSAPQGPKFEHVVQAAINGLSAGADEIVIGYASKEAISVNAAERKKISELGRFCAEWTLGKDEFEPIAVKELERIAGILELLDQGELPKRRFPTDELYAGHEIVDPATGRWEVRNDEGDILDTGTWWACGYCRYQTMCAKTPEGRIPVETVVSLDGAA